MIRKKGVFRHYFLRAVVSFDTTVPCNTLKGLLGPFKDPVGALVSKNKLQDVPEWIHLVIMWSDIRSWKGEHDEKPVITQRFRIILKGL